MGLGGCHPTLERVYIYYIIYVILILNMNMNKACNISVVHVKAVNQSVRVIFQPPALSHALIGRMRSSRKLMYWGASALPEIRVKPYGRL